jgi:hypothetical protein
MDHRQEFMRNRERLLLAETSRSPDMMLTGCL